jgi:cytochrome P450
VQFLAEAPQRWSALKADPGLIGSGSTALPDPDRFDLHRNPVDHLAFGYGIHSCTGQGLARIETQALFGLLLRRAGSIQLAGQPVRHVHPTLRGLERLPVTVASA